jgi:hypothetical protein
MNAENFALAVVASSSPDLTVDEKLELYKTAYLAAEDHNREFGNDWIKNHRQKR